MPGALLWDLLLLVVMVVLLLIGSSLAAWRVLDEKEAARARNLPWLSGKGQILLAVFIALIVGLGLWSMSTP